MSSAASVSSVNASGVPLGALDLSMPGVVRHFGGDDATRQLQPWLQALDRQDRWAVDFGGPSSPQAADVQRCLELAAHLVDTCVGVLHRVPKEFAEVLAHLTTSRCMYLVRHVSQRNLQFFESLAFLIASDGARPDVALIRSRFDAFSKAQRLGEIFSSQRLHRIVSIMGSYTDE